VNSQNQWQCFGCLANFDAGTQKYNETMRGNRELYTLSLCLRCKEAARRHSGYGDKYWEGELRELWSEEGIQGS
jgi:hypothetical protein